MGNPMNQELYVSLLEAEVLRLKHRLGDVAKEEKLPRPTREELERQIMKSRLPEPSGIPEGWVKIQDGTTTTNNAWINNPQTFTAPMREHL